MNRLVKISSAAGLAALLAACGSASTQGPDLGAVLDRTVMALDYAESEFEKPEDDTEAATQVSRFTELMYQAMNSEPLFYDKAIGVNLREDAAFLGFEDKNANNAQDAGEKSIFTVELDAERNRIIATDLVSGEGTYRISGTGIMAGYIAGRLLSRQSRAGVKSSSFANRNVKSRADYGKTRKPAKSARSRTRSGSARAGK